MRVSGVRGPWLQVIEPIEKKVDEVGERALGRGTGPDTRRGCTGHASVPGGPFDVIDDKLSTGPLAGSSLRPSCSWIAANIEGASAESSAAGTGTPSLIRAMPAILVPSRENLASGKQQPQRIRGVERDVEPHYRA